MEYEKAALYRDYLNVLNSQKIESGEDDLTEKSNESKKEQQDV